MPVYPKVANIDDTSITPLWITFHEWILMLSNIYDDIHGTPDRA